MPKRIQHKNAATRPLSSRRILLTGLTITLLPFAACTADAPSNTFSPTEPSMAVVSTGSVDDLTVKGSTESTVTLEWTQVSDGTGRPARYRMKYAESPLEDWKNAEIGCERSIRGEDIGADISCTVEGLDRETSYDFQLMSYRVESGAWAGARYSNVATETTSGPIRGVQDLEVASGSPSTITARWTQVDDGTGRPAKYRVRYAEPPFDWKDAAKGCDATGDRIGAELSCTFEVADAGTEYHFQLMSYRTEGGVWADAVYSNLATGITEHGGPAGAPDAPGSSDGGVGVWISRAEVHALPTRGSAWDNLLSAAARSCGGVDLSDQEQSTNVCVMAKALVFARTGEESYRRDVVTALTQVANAPRYSGRALALGRELGAYVIAADLIDLRGHDAALDNRFRAALRTLRTAYTTGAASSLIDCHERRPNNWGAHCGATRAAIAVYLDDADDLARTAQVFKGYLGDRSAYSGFTHGGPAGERDLSWQCDAGRPVGINPAGCTRNGMSLDGVLPDDQRRGGSFTTSPPRENYVWEALQGLLAQAVILHRAGYPVWEWEDRALLRAVEWLHDVADFRASGDDTWQPHIVNHYYGTSFPAPVPTRAGKNVGWTDWTHPR